MKYKVNEIFYSLQAEGTYAGCPAIFVRLSGCNLKCPWCDTKYHNEGRWYTKEELEQAVRNYSADAENVIVVFTGGEPTLQLKEEEELLPEYYRTIETNGTNPVPSWIDWITCSPKTDLEFNIHTRMPNEIKVVYEEGRENYLDYLKTLPVRLFLQPLEIDGYMNTKDTVEYIKKNPKYKLSLQFHKMINIQ